MGRTKMLLTAQMDEEYYKELPPEYRQNMTIIRIEPEDKPDHSNDKIWNEFKSIADKAYMNKKKREEQLKKEL